MNNNIQSGAGIVRYVLGSIRTPNPKLYLGLDLGQRRDHSALAAVQLGWIAHGRCPVTFAFRYQPELVIRAIERFPLGACYDKLHDVILDRIDGLSAQLDLEPNRAPADKQLIIDAGGPGPPMVDRLRQETGGDVNVRPVMITAGKGVNTLTGGYTGIPRRTLISNTLFAIGARSLRCHQGLETWDKFVAELVQLRGDTSQPNDPNAHDDMVMAVALAVDGAIRDTPELLPESRSSRAGSKVNFGFINKPIF